MLSQGEIHALQEAAERAWDEDTRHESYQGHAKAATGQCYVTSRWLQSRLGGQVGHKDGHFFWTDGKHALDITGDQFPGHRPPPLYKKADHPLFAGYSEAAGHPNAEGRVNTFIDRADREFEGLGDKISKTALDFAGDAFPAEEPQAADDIAQRFPHDNDYPDANEYKFVYAAGRLEVSPVESHDELLSNAGIDGTYAGPTATGYVSLNGLNATWEVTGNVGGQALARVFKDYGDTVGWKWGGMTDLEGEPIGAGSAFAPAKTTSFVFMGGHLYLGGRGKDLFEAGFKKSAASSHQKYFAGEFSQDHELVTIRTMKHGNSVFLSTAEGQRLTQDFLDSANEWAEDQNLRLVAGDSWADAKGGVGDRGLKTLEDLEMGNLYDPNPNQEETQFFPRGQDEREKSGLWRCPGCQRLFPNYHEYTHHRLNEEPVGDLDTQWPEEDGGFPINDMDATHPTHFTERQPAGINTGAVMSTTKGEMERLDSVVNEAQKYFVAYAGGRPIGALSTKNGARVQQIGNIQPILMHIGKEPKDLISDSVPFIYDVQEDAIFVGQEGSRTSDIEGRFTPGGIVEGTFEPGGKVLIRSMTNMPYTVRHMVELWYYQHPELEVKSVHLQDDEGGDTKLANQDVASIIQSNIAADPATQQAASALMQAGGEVYAVGGAIRDALLGKDPKDVDLLVRGLEADQVHATLDALPGRVDLTGKDFGVYRFRDGDSEVEVALPRRDRSTGDEHTDFDVQSDPNMSVEEDMGRRDFTANALALDLQTGQLIDPFGGAEDISNGTLKTVFDGSFSDDPLRLARALVARGRHGLVPDDNTFEQMHQHGPSIVNVPPDRVKDEIMKIMESDDPAGAIRLAHETGVLAQILPEVDAAFGFDQNNPHHELELGEHLLSVLDRTSKLTDDPEVRLAALLHDIGKPESAWVDPETGKNHYYKGPNGEGANHEELGADMASQRLDALRFPNATNKRVTDLVKHHMWQPFQNERGARRFLNTVGDHADDLINLRMADQGEGKTGGPGFTEVPNVRELIDTVRAGKQPTNRSQLAINGSDLINLGIKPGPEIGQILERLTQAVLDDPSVNERETLLQMAKTSKTAARVEEVTADMSTPTNIRGLDQRRPFLYAENLDTAFLGPPNSHHADLDCPFGKMGYVMLDDKTVSGWRVPPQALQSVAEYMGPEYQVTTGDYPSEGEEEWDY